MFYYKSPTDPETTKTPSHLPLDFNPFMPLHPQNKLTAAHGKRHSDVNFEAQDASDFQMNLDVLTSTSINNNLFYMNDYSQYNDPNRQTGGWGTPHKAHKKDDLLDDSESFYQDEDFDTHQPADFSAATNN